MDPTPSTSEPRAKRAWTVIAAWIGGISAVIGFVLTLTGAFGKLQDHFHSHAERDSQMAIAQSQTNQGDYAAAVQTFDNVLKSNSLYAPALDQQLQTTMLWVEDFHTLLKQGQDDAGPIVAAQLDHIIAILDAALVRTKGAQAADVQAHLGWTYWLNWHLARREVGPAAEKNLRAALTTDPNNVYANAMLGNWMLQNGGDLNEAVAHFQTAVSSGKQRALVRTMQVGGLTSAPSPRSCKELFRTANDMRKNNEPLDAHSKGSILFQCIGVSMRDHAEIANALSAVSPDDAWNTYLWLDVTSQDDADQIRYHAFLHDFISASLLEISGKPDDALAKYRALQAALKGHRYTLDGPVDDAIKRLSSK